MRAFAAAALLVLALSLACGQEEEATREDLASLTLEEAWARVAEAITRPGFVFHARWEAVGRGANGETTSLWEKEAWVDLQLNVGRWEFRVLEYGAETAERTVMVIVGDSAYYSDYDEAYLTDPLVCQGSDSALLSLAFECGGAPPTFEYQDPATFRVEADAKYQGQGAVALVFERSEVRELRREPPSPPTPERPPSAGTKLPEETPEVVEIRAISRLYLEPDTFLPIAWVIELSEGQNTGQFIAEFESTFVEPESLPADFFDPASIGYEPPEAPLDNPNLGVSVYWLGQQFEPVGAFPPLIFARAYGPTGPGGGPGNRAQVEYETAQREVAVVLLLWRPEDWQTFLQMGVGRELWDSPCVQTKEIALEGGRAVIFMAHEPEQPLLPPGPTAIPIEPGQPFPTVVPTPTPEPTPSPVGGCPSRPFDRFLAHVYFEDTVVTINIPLCYACMQGFGPYDSLEGIEAVVRGLLPR